MDKMPSRQFVQHTLERDRTMQVAVYLLLLLAALLRECEGQLGEHNEVPQVRWCVTTECEMKKCQRMAMEFNYKLSGHALWSCVMAATEEQCMHYISRGRAEVMTAEGQAVYKAGKIHNLIPVMYEKLDKTQLESFQKVLRRNNVNLSSILESNGEIRQYSVALVRKNTRRKIGSFKDLNQSKSCHGSVENTAWFKAPICSLIQKNVIPQVGDVYECAGEFFRESCVPGVQDPKYNTYLTNPESLCGICKGREADSFCEATDKEPYYGFKGAFKCLMEGAGDVGFFHTRDLLTYYGLMATGFDIICQDQRRPLTWKNIMKPECHLTVEHPQVVLMSSWQTKEFINMTTTMLKEAIQMFNTSRSAKEFSLFSSTSYCEDDEGQKTSDLIFKDSSYSLEVVPKEKMAYDTFLDSSTVGMWQTCDQLKRKPRAFICVVGESEGYKCKKLVGNLAVTPGTNTVSWGCVQVESRDECVRQVYLGGADIVSLNATEVFVAGKRYNLVPFMSEEIKGKDQSTESITVAVMRKNNTVLGKTEWLRGWKFCSPGGVYSPAFLHSIGWLLANGSIPRLGDPIRSFSAFMDNSCQRGMSPQYLMNDPFLRELINWEELLENRVVDWNDYYQASPYPALDKDDPLSDDIMNIPMYKKYDFNSEVMHQLFYTMATDWSDVVHKIRDRFDWANYTEKFHEFYDVMPKWKLIDWVWTRPAFWSEREWHLFTRWAEKRWDQEEDWCSFVDWSTEDWVKFMRWNDVEYSQYSKEVDPVHKDIFIRTTMYCNRLEWLKDQWRKVQWEIPELRRCLHETAQNSTECLSDIVVGTRDIAFMDVYYLNSMVVKDGINRDELILLCPNGSNVDFAKPEAHQACNFGRIASRALVIHENQDAKWRWQVSKALLEAQKHLFFADDKKDELHASEDQDGGFFGEDCEKLKPISLVNQTYQTWLGPLFLRSMESLLQGFIKNDGDMSYNECPGCETEERWNSLYGRGSNSDDPHIKGPHNKPSTSGGDGSSARRSHLGDPHIKGPHNKPRMNGGGGSSARRNLLVDPHIKGPHNKPRTNGGDGSSAGRRYMGDPHQKGPHMKGGVGPHMKGPRMNGGDGSSARRRYMGDPHQKGPHMKGGVGPHMKGPRMNGGDGSSARRRYMGDPHQKGPHMKGGVGPHMKGPRMNGGDGSSARRRYMGDPHQKGPHMKGGVGPHMKGPRMNGGDGSSARRRYMGDPHQKGPHMKGGVGPHMKGPRMNGGDGSSARRRYMGDPHQKGPHMKGGVGPHMKGPRMNGGDGSSARRRYMGDPHQKGPHMKGGVGPHMKGPRMNGGDGSSAWRGPRIQGIGGARGENMRRPLQLPMRALMYFWKPRSKRPLPVSRYELQEEPPLTDLNVRHVEVGPTIREVTAENDQKWPREEVYTKVVYERNGTCSAILREVSCFGALRTITHTVGRIGRTVVSIPMCSTASAYAKTYAEFTCDNGLGYLAPVMMPTQCLYLPCRQQSWIPEWTRDEYWKEERKLPDQDCQVGNMAPV